MTLNMSNNDDNSFSNRLKKSSRLLTNSTQFHRKDLMMAIQEAEQTQAGLGFFINANMLDFQVSAKKDEIIDYIADVMNQHVGEGELLEDLMRRALHVANRQPYLLRTIGSNTEQVIDWQKMKKAIPAGDDDALEAARQMEDLAREQTLLAKQMYGTCEDEDRDPAVELQVVPWCFTIGGFQGGGRIPKKMRDRQPLVVETDLCRMYKRIQKSAEELRLVLTDIEWSLARPCPIEVEQFLASHADAEAIYDFSGELRSWWYSIWQEIREDETAPDMDDEGKRELFKQLEDDVVTVLQESEFNDVRPYVAAALMLRIYKTDAYRQAPEPGETFPDGLLWIRPIARALLEAFDMMGLSGKITKIDFAPKYQGLRHLKLDVRVVKGLVYVLEDGRQIGTIKDTEDGDYSADGGLIKIKAAHSILKMESYVEKGALNEPPALPETDGYYYVTSEELAYLKAEYEADPIAYGQVEEFPPFHLLKVKN